MKVPTVKNVLRKKFKEDTDGVLTIRVGLVMNPVPVIKSYGYKIPLSQWDAVNEIVKKSHNDYNQINAEIAKEKERVADLIKAEHRKGNIISKEYVESILYQANTYGSFLQFFSEHLEIIRARHSKGYSDHFLIEYNALKHFGGPNLDFRDITGKFLERYELSLVNRQKGISSTTLHTKFKKLKEVIARAIDRGLIEKKAIAGYSWPGWNNPEREYLTLDECKRIESALYAGEFDDDRSMKVVATYFLIGCYSGLRVSDWSRFEIEHLKDGDAIKVRAQKNKQEIYLRLEHFPSLKTLNDYIQANGLKFDVTGTAANRIIKIIAKSVTPKIVKKKITCHISRHTFATLTTESGASLTWVAQALGIKESTAEIYRKITAKRMEDETKRIKWW